MSYSAYKVIEDAINKKADWLEHIVQKLADEGINAASICIEYHPDITYVVVDGKILAHHSSTGQSD